MVTVPALGPEWKLSEMRDMTKAGKREKKAEARKEAWKLWKRDQVGLCGGWLTRRVFVFILFVVCAAYVYPIFLSSAQITPSDARAGLILAFALPRVPSFAFNGNTPLTNATGSFAAAIPIMFSRFPANFTFPANAELQVDTGSNYFPLTFLHLRGKVLDLDSNRQVASGDLERKTVPAKAFPIIKLPLNFTYVASNDTDQTCAP
jgi:hypothetical protein